MRFNLYTALEILAFTSDQHVIKSAYRRQVKYYHPDSGNVEEGLARNHTIVLNRIYKILSDPIKKADYDSYLARTANDPL